MYTLKNFVSNNIFSVQFIKGISHCLKISDNINLLQQTACLAVDPIIVDNFAFISNCTTPGQRSDSMMVPTSKFICICTFSHCIKLIVYKCDSINVESLFYVILHVLIDNPVI